MSSSRRRETRRLRPLRAGTLLLLVIALGSCQGSQKVNGRVPAAGGGTCRIAVGEVRGHVRLRCGAPCSSAKIPDGLCADGREGACENQCDIYQDVEVCFLGEKVASITPIDREFGRFQWCFWPNPELEALMKKPVFEKR